MNTTYTKIFIGTPFAIECSRMENKPGTWSSTKVSIFRDDILIGEYLRNYDSFGPNTFYPFLIGEDWFALYSASYTSSRILKLHADCIENWCGEDDKSTGFCPVEYYVPRYNKFESNDLSYYMVDTEYKKEVDFITGQSAADFRDSKYCNFGFLCGCVWGDDSSWKIRYIDLSKILNKELVITEKFGYWEMPESLTLKESVNMSGWQPDNPWIRLYKTEYINLNVDS